MNLEKKQSIVFKSWNAYGDYLSYNGLIRHFLDYYDEVQYICSYRTHRDFIRTLYNDIADRIIFRDLNNFVVDDQTDIADGVSEHFGLFTTQGRHQYHHLHHFPHPGTKTLQENFEKNNVAQLYNKAFGVLPDLRLSKFYYRRNMEEEVKMKEDLLRRNNIADDEPYLVSNGPLPSNPTLKVININNAVEMPLHLLKTMEDAQELHMQDNMLLLMVFYMQGTGIMSISHPVHYYISTRYRGEYIVNTMIQPRLPHWVLHRDPNAPTRD